MSVELFNYGVLIIAANTFICFVIATYSAVTKKGVWTTNNYDYLFFIIGIIGIILWQLFNNPDLAIGAAIIADLAFGIPNLVKVYKKPNSETIYPWAMATLSGITSLVAVSYISFTEVAYPIYLTIYDSSVLLIIIVYLAKSKAIRA